MGATSIKSRILDLLGDLVIDNTAIGQLRRANQQNKNILSLKVKDVMTKNPLSVNKDTLAAKSLSIMSENKITSLCVHKNKNKKRTIGILHIHHILNANIQ